MAAARPGRVAGDVVRRRAAAVRDVGRELMQRVRASQLGTVRPGLTIDDGSTVVTDNFLKVKIERGLPRNCRVNVRIDGTPEALTGNLIGS